MPTIAMVRNRISFDTLTTENRYLQQKKCECYCGYIINSVIYLDIIYGIVQSYLFNCGYVLGLILKQQVGARRRGIVESMQCAHHSLLPTRRRREEGNS